MEAGRNRRGIALLIVLWVLAILMVMVFSFSITTRADLTSTAAYSRGMEKKFIAEAGLNRAITELFFRKHRAASPEQEPWKIDGRPYREDIGGAHYVVAITDETGKVDINAAPDIILRRLLTNIGAEAEKIDIIIDSLMDWKDPDDLYRVNGAESDYYRSLPDPYEAKNNPFETPEELILIRGVTRDILFGGEEGGGLADLVTVHTKSNRINVKAAPKGVLMALPGVDEFTAEAIIEYRRDKEIKNVKDVQAIAGLNYGLMARYVTVTEGRVFTVDSVGYRKGDPGGYPIRATLVIEGNDRYRFVYYKSPAYGGRER